MAILSERSHEIRHKLRVIFCGHKLLACFSTIIANDDNKRKVSQTFAEESVFNELRFH